MDCRCEFLAMTDVVVLNAQGKFLKLALASQVGGAGSVDFHLGSTLAGPSRRQDPIRTASRLSSRNASERTLGLAPPSGLGTQGSSDPERGAFGTARPEACPCLGFSSSAFSFVV